MFDTNPSKSTDATATGSHRSWGLRNRSRDLDIDRNDNLEEQHAHPRSTLIPQLQLPVLAPGAPPRHLNLDRDFALHEPHIRVRQALSTMICDSDRHPDSLSLLVAEAILLDDARDGFLDGKLSEEDGPVVVLDLWGADVDAQGYGWNSG